MVTNVIWGWDLNSILFIFLWYNDVSVILPPTYMWFLKWRPSQMIRYFCFGVDSKLGEFISDGLTLLAIPIWDIKHTNRRNPEHSNFFLFFRKPWFSLVLGLILSLFLSLCRTLIPEPVGCPKSQVSSGMCYFITTSNKRPFQLTVASKKMSFW